MSVPCTKIKKGMTILLDNVIYTVVDHQFNKPGKGAAFVRFKLKNFKTGAVLEKNFRSDFKIEQIVVEERNVEYLYREGDLFHFMNQETYDQIAIPLENMGGGERYLLDNMLVKVAYFRGEFLGVDMPVSVELRVASTEPGVKGDTVSSATKPATLESGLVVQVPLFINEGDVLKVDTQTNAYLGRV